MAPHDDHQEFSRLWTLEPGMDFLNHGSFGACPRPVLDAQDAVRARMEREPVRFFVRELEPLQDEALTALASFLGADPEGLAFVPNATTGVSTVLASLQFAPGDELLTTSHAYNACRNALDAAAARWGARVVVARVPFPLRSPTEARDAVLACVTPRTRLLLLDHVTSPTALVLPVAELVRELAALGIETLVDGAHAPGMLPLDLRALGAAYYTGNLHKWVCAPKGAAFLYAREDVRGALRPLVVSHGANATRTDRARFRLEFDWTGTLDPSAYLAVPAALAFLDAALPGGWDAVRARNRALALHARDLLCTALGVEPPCPDEMLGSMAAVALPDGPATPPAPPWFIDPLQDALFDRGIEVPVVPWPAWPRRFIRVSAQLYNHEGQYIRLAESLRALLPPRA